MDRHVHVVEHGQTGHSRLHGDVLWLSMTASELVEMERRGERIPRQPHSLHDVRKPGACEHSHGWRTIVCDGISDVCECPDCGAHIVTACNFDEEFS